jgi:hypothetical protein
MWQSQVESNANKICKTLGERCNGAERLNVFSNISERSSLVFYCEKKHKRGKESYIDECTRRERMGIIRLKAGIRKRRGFGRRFREEGDPYVWRKMMLNTYKSSSLKRKSIQKKLYAVSYYYLLQLGLHPLAVVLP